MKVNPKAPFKLIYSVFLHEYLGFLLESYVVQVNEKGNLTLASQNISFKNAKEFGSGLEPNDYELIRWMDEIQQEAVAFHFSKGRLNPTEFFKKHFESAHPQDKIIRQEIDNYVERRRQKIMPQLAGKSVFEMGQDGNPIWQPIVVLPERATIRFHFKRSEENTVYYPTIKLSGELMHFREKECYLLTQEPVWVMVNRRLFTFDQPISSGKIKPFLTKRNIVIPKNMEDEYYDKFVSPLIANYEVLGEGFEIISVDKNPTGILTLTEVRAAKSGENTLFSTADKIEYENKVLIELSYNYGKFRYKADLLSDVNVSLEKKEDKFFFYKILRKRQEELTILHRLQEMGLPLKNARVTLAESHAFDWLNRHKSHLEKFSIILEQNFTSNGKNYFFGNSSIEVKIEEKIDWFDIHAVVRFGDFEIPFSKIRRLILQNKTELKLPNGQIAVIPSSWNETYRDLFYFATEEDNNTRLAKYHVALVSMLKIQDQATVSMSERLHRLLDFTSIDEQCLPMGFLGDLRPYQQAGYNWLLFLEEYGFGGCLADDMGLGKTVQTLALLQHQASKFPDLPNLLIMPTSLLYNWEMEARKFTPHLRIHVFSGTSRSKDPQTFKNYDLILTSYGVARIDIDFLSTVPFNYVILDESQAIKNPNSLTYKAVRELKARRRLVLTGTPIENSTLDLWSQISFVNPGLLGAKSYFNEEYLVPIEKKQDQQKLSRLNALIKPFILRRDKTQVARDLPEKTISVQYCTMTAAQEEFYLAERDKYRNLLLNQIEKEGIGKSQMMVLEGLNRLRQIANHPAMVDDSYRETSGKMEDLLHMIENALTKDHNLLIFSQFVKHLKLVTSRLDALGIPYAYLDGSVKDRKERVESFQNNKNIRIFLISLKAGGVGLNLTKADYVFILDPWWNPAAEAQAIDRAHRIGQVNKVFTYKFISRGTLEEKILVLQEKKSKLAKDLISIEESFVKHLTPEDIKQLLS